MVKNDILLYDDNVVVPKSPMIEILSLIYNAHQWIKNAEPELGDLGGGLKFPVKFKKW